MNNAGGVIGVEKVGEIPQEAIDYAIDVNLKGLINMTQLVLPRMKERNIGHIINIGSIAGKEAYAGGSIYCATKVML